MNRNLIVGAGLAAALMLLVMAVSGGEKAGTPAAPAPVAKDQALSTTINFLAEPGAPAAKTEAAPKPEAPKAEAAPEKAQPKPQTSEAR